MCVHVGSRSMQALGNEACDSRWVKPKDSPSHPGQPGQGKTGRANPCEPSTRLRNRKVAVTTMADTAMSGQGPTPDLSPANGHPGPAVEKAPAPAASHRAQNAATPMRSGLCASKPDDLRHCHEVVGQQAVGPVLFARLAIGLLRWAGVLIGLEGRGASLRLWSTVPRWLDVGLTLA
jgi:hypothetical protein